jgi:hypothetical protein
MADVSFFDPKKEAEVKRRRLMAQQIMKQSAQTPNEVVSGIVVEKSPLEGLAKALGSGVAGYQAGQADRLQTEDAEAKQRMYAEALGAKTPRDMVNILGQSPAGQGDAMNIRMAEMENERAKELAQMRISAMGSGGGNTPAAMQISGKMFELEQKMNDPNMPEEQRFLAQREYNLLGQAAKTYGFDRGIGYGGGLEGYSSVYGGQQPMANPPAMTNNAALAGGQSVNQPMPQTPIIQQGAMPSQSPSPIQPPRIGEISGYSDVMSDRAGRIKAAETTAASDAKYMAEGRQMLPKAQRALQAAELRGQNIRRVAEQSAQTAQKAFTTGFTGSIMGAVAGTAAFDLKNNLQTLEATAAFDTLQNMRDNSPTGGALGNVTERELDLLKAAYSNLANSQSYEQFVQNLEAFNRQNTASLQNAKAAYEQDYQRFGGAQDKYLPAPQGLAPQGAATQAPQVNNRDNIIQQLKSRGRDDAYIQQFLQANGL